MSGQCTRCIAQGGKGGGSPPVPWRAVFGLVCRNEGRRGARGAAAPQSHGARNHVAIVSHNQ